MGDAGLVLLDGVRWHGARVPGERSHALLAALVLEAPRAVGDDHPDLFDQRRACCLDGHSGQNGTRRIAHDSCDAALRRRRGGQ